MDSIAEASRYRLLYRDAEVWTRRHLADPFCQWSSPVEGADVPLRAIIDGMTDALTLRGLKSAEDLVGECYRATREASYVLFGLGVRHSVTIGNVVVDGRSHYEFTRALLEAELAEGYRESEPAAGHAWLTLVDGSVLDASILASLRARTGVPQTSLRESFFFSGKTTGYEIRHEPLLVGFGYQHHVVSCGRADGVPATYEAWFEDYRAFELRQHDEV